MTAEQIVGFSIYISGALIFSVATVLALGAALEVEGRWRLIMLPALYTLILLDSCMAPLLNGRDQHARGVQVTTVEQWANGWIAWLSSQCSRFAWHGSWRRHSRGRIVAPAGEVCL